MTLYHLNSYTLHLKICVMLNLALNGKGSPNCCDVDGQSCVELLNCFVLVNVCMWPCLDLRRCYHQALEVMVTLMYVCGLVLISGDAIIKH